MRRVSGLMVLAAILCAVGLGCAPAVHPVEDLSSASSTAATSSAVNISATPVSDVGSSLRLAAGDVFEIRQTLPGGGIFSHDVVAPIRGTRLVTLTDFSPTSHVTLSWSALGDDLQHPATASGNVDQVNVLNSHEVLLPLLWTSASQAWTRSTSGIWLSSDVFQEFTHTHQASIDLGFSDPRVQEVLAAWPQGEASLQHIRALADAASNHQVDVSSWTVDGKAHRATVEVNGKSEQLSVLEAHSWFGDMTILDDAANPLIIRLTLKQGGVNWFDFQIDHLIVSGFTH